MAMHAILPATMKSAAIGAILLGVGGCSGITSSAASLIRGYFWSEDNRLGMADGAAVAVAGALVYFRRR